MLGLKLSILDVRCREPGGATFIVEMQVLHVTGVLNRVVYNACKAYVGALKKGATDGELVDVVAVSICDFVLWPDAERDAANASRVPLVRRWSMAEQASGHRALGRCSTSSSSCPSSETRSPTAPTNAGRRSLRTHRIWSPVPSSMFR